MSYVASPLGLSDGGDARCAGVGDDAHGSWYAIHTKPRMEGTAAAFLHLRSIQTFLPRLLVRRRHASRRWDALEPLFPGYLFARFTPDPGVIARVRWSPGVRAVLGDGETPVSVPDDVVAVLQDRARDKGFIAPSRLFPSGMRVRFRSGPLAYLEGIIERPASGSDRVRVLLTMLGTAVPVTVESDELEYC